MRPLDAPLPLSISFQSFLVVGLGIAAKKYPATHFYHFSSIEKEPSVQLIIPLPLKVRF